MKLLPEKTTTVPPSVSMEPLAGMETPKIWGTAGMFARTTTVTRPVDTPPNESDTLTHAPKAAREKKPP